MNQPYQRCQYCQAYLEPGVRFCENCGQPVTETAPPLPHPIQPTRQRKSGIPVYVWILLAGIVLLSLVCGLVGGYFLLTRQADSLAAAPTPDSPPTAFAQAPPSIDIEPSPIPPTTQPQSQVPTPTTQALVEPTLTETLIPESPPEIPPSEPVVYLDDFSNRDLDWATTSHDNGYVDYHEGGTFAIAIGQPETFDWSYPQVIVNREGLDDVVVSVSGNRVEGDGYWGVICRVSVYDDYYLAAVWSTYYTIARMQNGVLTYLTTPDWVQDDRLNPDLYENGMIPITVGCIGDTIDLEIAGDQVAVVQDSALTEGWFELIAVSDETPVAGDYYYLKVLFDDFMLYIP
jgi:hypothetical protein